MSDAIVSFIKRQANIEEDVSYFFSGPDEWRKHIDILGLTAMWNHIRVYNKYISTENTRIDNEFYRFEKIELFDIELKKCIEFWYVDMINHWTCTNLERDDIVYYFKHKIKKNQINMTKFNEMVKLYGDPNCSMFAILREIGVLNDQ